MRWDVPVSGNTLLCERYEFYEGNCAGKMCYVNLICCVDGME